MEHEKPPPAWLNSLKFGSGFMLATIIYKGPEWLASGAKAYTTVFAYSGNQYQDLLSTIQTIGIVGCTSIVLFVLIWSWRSKKNQKEQTEALVSAINAGNQRVVEAVQARSSEPNPPVHGGKSSNGRLSATNAAKST